MYLFGQITNLTKCFTHHPCMVYLYFLHLVVFNGKEAVNVGRYTIHGCYGISKLYNHGQFVTS